jgi:putative two-component system response regulator
MERQLILICDDIEINRVLLHDIFEEQFEIIEAANGEDAIEMIELCKDSLNLIFLDLVMPGKNGIDVLRYMNRNDYIKRIPVIMITGEATVESDVKAYEYGAADIIYKPFEPEIVMRRAMNIIELYAHRNDMENQLEKNKLALAETNEKLMKNNEFLINALSSVVEFRSLESGEHINRVKAFTKVLMENVRLFYPEYGITKEQEDLIVSASALHDIGKIAIPDEILLKPGKLTPSEFAIMKQHTTKGCEILEKFKQDDNEFYKYCYEICRWHHERVDGKGYPDGLQGDEIPIWAQVVSLVDVYDALVNRRCYKPAYHVKEATRMIMDGECGMFSEKILNCFDMAKNEFYLMTQNDDVAMG